MLCESFPPIKNAEDPAVQAFAVSLVKTQIKNSVKPLTQEQALPLIKDVMRSCFN
jgi:hypothetical protein